MAERDTYHHGDLRRELVERATQAIREGGGADRFSLRATARAAGVDVAATYRHFRDKGDLLAAVAAGGFAALARRMERAQAGATDARERFRAVGRAYVGFAVEEPALFRLMFGPHGSGRPGVDVRGSGDGGRDPYETLLACLTELDEEGRLGVSIDEATLPAWAAVHGLAHLAVEGNLDPAVVHRRTEAVMDHVLRGLSAPP